MPDIDTDLSKKPVIKDKNREKSWKKQESSGKMGDTDKRQENSLTNGADYAKIAVKQIHKEKNSWK